MPAAEWLLKKNCNVNPVDRFARTPLEVGCPPCACYCPDCPKQQLTLHPDLLFCFQSCVQSQDRSSVLHRTSRAELSADHVK